jgi:ABC-type uncharacterized transport system YnjBCD ATPase subunit
LCGGRDSAVEHLFERKPRELSGRQRQRVVMGRAIVPICTLIAMFQERVVGGLTSGGLKAQAAAL